ncbi:class I SAM-dependent methyltransferase [Effusibacillus dendaii]|uniref:SAM-dependent methyltransferase n=1 Tax=Effusibacillus dendaii TaxID=2743772 RepID=A0A7I8D943_9BACL|nr:class I SAM-dependent methyltransferase [Effusibacillus dendaii]BCJ85040.1 SAM-dependent methyltransferase [Effusibacillus dendaii]
MENDKTIKDTVKQQFAKNAEKYVTSESHAKADDLTLLLEWLNPQPDWVVLDIATGGGHVAKTLAPHVQSVFSTDLTRQMLENTAAHLKPHFHNIWYMVADAESLPFLDSTFDVVTCRLAPHHFPNPDQFVREAERVLKPKGKFLLIDNVAPSDPELADFMNTFEKLRDESHVRCLSIKEWRELFQSVGLREANSRTRKKTYDFPVWATRMANDSEQAECVKQFMKEGSQKLQQYFSVIMHEGQIQSLQVDEWMVLCEKSPSQDNPCSQRHSQED